MGNLVVSTHEGVATVVVDHPPINLMTVPVYLELAETIDRLAADDDVRVVAFRSANPEWFIAHFDVAAILEFPRAPQPMPTELSTYHLMCEQLRQMPKATIAVIEGRVGGGGSELALSCDMRFAGPTAIFNQPEVALGIIPGGTGTVRLPRPDRTEPSAGGDPRLRRHRRRHGRAVGLGQPGAADRRAGDVRRSAGGPHRLVPAARRRRGEGQRRARRVGCRRAAARRGPRLLRHARRPADAGAMERFLAQGRPDARG